MNPRTRRLIVTAVLVLVVAAVILGGILGGGVELGETSAAWATRIPAP